MSDLKALQYELGKVESRIDKLHETLSGCDWCCGGGDEETAELRRKEVKLRKALGITN